MKYCMNCGKQLPDDAKFCVSCGTPVQTETPPPPPQPQKNVEKAGTLHKCPNCGEVLDSFTAICPACGYEVRGAKAASSVQTFAEQLDQIEAEQMPVSSKKSVMKTVLGKDLSDLSAKSELAFDSQKRSKKLNLISNFPIPNTKEDILEFMFLAVSNIQGSAGLDDALLSAWTGKLEQAYRKAKISMRNDPDFKEIEAIYSQVVQKARLKKMWPAILLGGLFGLGFFMMGIERNPILTIFLTIAVVGLACGGLILAIRGKFPWQS